MPRIRPIAFILPFRPPYIQLGQICLRFASTEATASPTTTTRTSKYRKWTPEENDLIIRMYEQRKPFKEIARALGISSLKALKSHIRRVRQLRAVPPSSTPNRKFSPKEDDFIISKTLQGRTSRWIAEQLGSSAGAVWLRRRKLTPDHPELLAATSTRGPTKVWTDAEKNLVAKMYQEGSSITSISDALGIAKPQLAESIIARLQRKGVLAKRFPRPSSALTPPIHPAQADQIKRLREVGLSFKKIAMTVGSSPASVYRHLQADVNTSLGRERKFWTSEETEKLLQLRSSGSSFHDIAPELRRSQAACRTKYRLIMREQAFKARIGSKSNSETQHCAAPDSSVANSDP